MKVVINILEILILSNIIKCFEKTNNTGSSFKIVVLSTLSTLCTAFFLGLLMIFCICKLLLSKETKNHESKFSKDDIELQCKFKTRQNILTFDDKVYTFVDVKDLKSYISTNKANKSFGFATEFETIELINTGRWKITHPYLQHNLWKNRYVNIVPYDHSRVILQNTEYGKSDYINASFVDSYNRRNAYIATQKPMTETMDDFWQMVYEQNAEIIVMISDIEEHEYYWVPNKITDYGIISVRHIFEKKIAFFTERRFVIRSIKEINNALTERTIYHYQFTSAMDFENPSTCLQIIKFITTSIKYLSVDIGPIIVHSDSSVGYTGIYICSASQICQMEVEQKINVKCFLEHIAQQRMELIQTNIQYVFIHEVLYEYYISRDNEVPKDLFSLYLSKISKNNISGFSYLEEQFKILQLNNVESLDRRQSYEVANRRSMNLSLDIRRLNVSSELIVNVAKLTNSSFIQGYWKMKEYIITQHPFDVSEHIFWDMVLKENCGIIVVLSNSELPLFWPQNERDSQTSRWGRINYCNSKSQGHMANYCFLLNSLKEDYAIDCTLHQLKQWPDNIREAKDLLQILFEIHSFKWDSPIVIIDDFGGSKAGIFLSLSYLINQLRNDDVIDVFFIVKIINMERPNIFRSSDNIKFICDLLEFIIANQNSFPFFKNQLPSYYFKNPSHQSLLYSTPFQDFFNEDKIL